MCVNKNPIYINICISFLLVILFTNKSLIAQISGISASKLIVPNTETVEVGKFEFEPSFFVAKSFKYFDATGNAEKLGGKYVNSKLNFRVTFGLRDNIELGTSFSSTVEEICVGAKYRIKKFDPINFGLIAGINLPVGNKFYPDSLIDKESHYYYSLGAVSTYNFSEKFSMDVVYSFTYVKGTEHSHYKNTTGISVGYSVTEIFQIISEMVFEFGKNDGLNEARTSSVAGFTYTVTDNLIFVLGGSFDLLGKNTEQFISYFSAFTITL